MPWLMGIDEAGYGPNLGPFVMSSALFHLPEGCNANLWKVLRAAVRKANTKADGRLMVDDSKQVYSPKIGLGVLEKNLWPFIVSAPPTLDHLWQTVCIQCKSYVEHEPYFDWSHPLPLSSPSASSAALLNGVLANTGVRLEQLQTNVVPPRQFNTITRDFDSKAAVPLTSIKQLLKRLPPDEPIDIMIDRLGGRQRYAMHLADWFPDQEITIEIETPDLSRYRIGDRITISFQVEADQHSFPVALSSMLSKYWRELSMAQFNAWFRQHQEDLTPTAGYPTDAGRFWKDVEPTRQRLNLINDDWWRER